ncbi:MAG TPA: L-serine ammonia-lyase [Anaerolineaceae bacterium]|nr:L-serine ammonia-lyase [Anaerolineaceae bacterium]
MESICELYKIGNGPSSSHTMGPRKAAEVFSSRTSDATSYRVTLFGSLAATGRGHLTDITIVNAMYPKQVEFIWKPDELLPLHPNGMRFEALNSTQKVTDIWEVYSPGGGVITDSSKNLNSKRIYPHEIMSDILRECTQVGKSFWEYVLDYEDDSFSSYLHEVWSAMKDSINRGLISEGVLPGGLGVSRRARNIYRKIETSGEKLKKEGFLPAYALAVAEENAMGERIVTAPTCGSAGILPAVLRYVEETFETTELDILHALATAGLIGNLIKTNASISGAEVGCQGEVGSACSMAAAAAAQMMGGSIRQVEYAAEMGLEHHLGLTCDPVNGLVQIPCIERNAFAATRALDCATFALYSDGSHRISFDEVVRVMAKTGRDLPHVYRETAEGGLAIVYRFPPGKPQ